MSSKDIKDLERKESDELELLKKDKKRQKALIKEAKKKGKKERKLQRKSENRKARKEARQAYLNRPLSERELLIKQRNEPPKLSVLEEVGNSVTHGVGALFAIIALILMLLKSNTPVMILASIVYGVSMFIMMLNSCLYHSWRSGSTVKRLWRRFDYSSIYLLIGGTFAPLQLIELTKNNNIDIGFGILWFVIMWVLIITGITMTCIFGPGRVRWLNFPLYFILGWSGLIYIPIWIIHDRINLLLWILIGGLVYTFGMIPFVKRGTKAAHFIWHFFVLAGAITHFIGIYLLVYF